MAKSTARQTSEPEPEPDVDGHGGQRPGLVRRLRGHVLALALSAAIGASAVVLAGCESSASNPDPRMADQLVRLAPAESAETEASSFSGVVSARVQSNLGFRVSGKVVERLADAGQSVRRGQPLMRMDATDYAHAVTVQEGGVEAARAKMLQTAADEARYRPLIESGAVSRSTYDQVKAAADGARAALSAAEAQLTLARDDATYATLRADADGTVVDTSAEPGQYVSAGQIVIRLARSGPREATINLPETVRPAIGSTATVELYGRGDGVEQSRAQLRQLSDAADPSTRTFEARYVLQGAAAGAPLGATVTVRLPGSMSGDLAVPLAAVNDNGGGPGVWVYDRTNSTVAFQRVQFVRFDGERAIVRGGLHVGDAVVALGGHLLHPAQRVRVDESKIASN